MRDWQEGSIDPESLAADPVDEFLKWYEIAKASDDMLPEAMSLATVTADGRPTVRVVLMRGCDERGVSFFTNYDSPKCVDMEANPNVALTPFSRDSFPTQAISARVFGNPSSLSRSPKRKAPSKTPF